MIDLEIPAHERQRRADAYDGLVAALVRLRDDYRTLWGMTLGHDGHPPTEGTADDIERLRASFTDLNGETPVMTTIDLSGVHLSKGAHDGPDDGVCLMEWVSMLAGAPFSDSPPCVSPYLRRFGIRLNDLATDKQRQELIQFGPRVLNTAGDGLDDLRRWIGADHAIRVATPRWLDKAGLTGHAETLRALAPIVDQATYDASRPAIDAARDAAYQARRTMCGGKSRYEYIRDAVKAKLAKTKPDADAATTATTATTAATTAADAADADAVAVAVADADAVAVADADADAAADAVAADAADADAVAAAVADAAADAVADAVADDAADFKYGSKHYWEVREAVYAAARAVYEERYADLIAESWTDAVTLFGRLINPAA